MARRIKNMVLILLALLLAGTALALALAFQSQPLLKDLPGELSPAQLQLGRDFLRRNDPRRLAGSARRLEISEAELNLLLGQIARRRPQTALDVRLQPGWAVLRASTALPLGWLNIEALLAETATLPELRELRIGRLPVPAWLANGLLRRLLLQQLQQHYSDETRLAGELIDGMVFGAQRLRINYRWQADSMERVLAGLWPAAEQARVRAHHEHLRALVAALPAGQPVSLAALLPQIFALVRERTAQGQDAAAENRAALLTLALYASGKGWAELMPAARAWPPVRPLLTVTLFGRDDFPQHFLVSACLAIDGGGPLADAIGVYKEVADARDGSGFSFNDIAADRAGTRLGRLAVREPARLQAALVEGLQEHDFMPEVADLPEFMREQDFVRRYGGIGAPAYRQMMSDIEARLDAIPLLHGAASE
ncbi:hypothetical protein [Roseateles violae]|uniref:Uncharacterized protein n=1 Tax=Roseateles violae TaxID=3058042 RepID=A0ABT8DRW9_9BURK|nr:hypothetical protein [Pelomonas sp. PFR6]MDN3919067.1 hypothetical protein [Pelomonas sp. PFR6]